MSQWDTALPDSFPFFPTMFPPARPSQLGPHTGPPEGSLPLSSLQGAPSSILPGCFSPPNGALLCSHMLICLRLASHVLEGRFFVLFAVLALVPTIRPCICKTLLNGWNILKSSPVRNGQSHISENTRLWVVAVPDLSSQPSMSPTPV